MGSRVWIGLVLVGCNGDAPTSDGLDPFADALVRFEPGPGAGFGQLNMPNVLFGPPMGGGNAGSLDVVSLGDGGEVVLEFTDLGLVDGPGDDLLVFENAFAGWPETGFVAVSDNGEDWEEWPCEPTNGDDDFPGCAGVNNVWTHPDNDIDPTDPRQAGGEAFDLADLGMDRARFVRIRDSGENTYSGETGGFDLDALAVVNGEDLNP